MNLIWIAGCGAIGALLRFGISHWCERFFGDHFPVGTLVVNVVGCFLLGFLAEWIAGTEANVDPHLHQGIRVGLLGALTTFSTFGHETIRRLEEGNFLVAAGNVAANLLLGLLAVWLGIASIRALRS